MYKPLVVTSAYGRWYDDSLSTARMDWRNGKDFRVYPDGPYLSNRDIPLLIDGGYTWVWFFGLGILEDFIK